MYRATYYYSVSLHYLRLFNIYRHVSARYKYTESEGLLASFAAEHLPYYPLVQLSSTLADIAEVFYARIDIEAMVRDLNSGYKMNQKTKEKQYLFGEGFANKKLSEDEIECRLNRFTITAGVYFDTWSKYADPSDSRHFESKDFVIAARDILQNRYEEYDELFSLWNDKHDKVLIDCPLSYIKAWLGVVNCDSGKISCTHHGVKNGESDLISSRAFVGRSRYRGEKAE